LTESNIQEIFNRISSIRSGGVIERYGFDEFLELAREVRTKVSDDVWLEVGWEILEGLGLEELYGVDYDILTALEHIPPESDVIDIQSFFRHTLVETMLEQFESGGTTVLLDIGKMVGTPMDVLIPQIIELRKNEIGQLTLPIIGREIDIYNVYMEKTGSISIPKEPVLLHDLWMTAYGCQILTTLGFGLCTNLEGLKKIEIVLKRMGFILKSSRADQTIQYRYSKMSSAMRMLLLKRAKNHSSVSGKKSNGGQKNKTMNQ